MKLTAADIQDHLRYHFRDHCCIPNIALKMGFESDLIVITKSGHWYECEIKLSVNDFYADFRKATSRYGQYGGRIVKKHDLLANEAYGPRKFYFACPENLLRVDQMPVHAGLIYICPPTPHHDHVSVSEAKPAPTLKGVKLDQNHFWRALNGLDWRYWSARRTLPEIEPATEPCPA